MWIFTTKCTKKDAKGPPFGARNLLKGSRWDVDKNAVELWGWDLGFGI